MRSSSARTPLPVALQLLAKAHAIKDKQARDIPLMIGRASFPCNVRNDADGRFGRNSANVKDFVKTACFVRHFGQM